MLTICICDDEVKEVSNLRRIITPKLDLTGIPYTIKEFSSGEACLHAIRSANERYDIIFLDIEMEKMNGVQTAKAIRQIDTLATIIFVTSHPEYVFDGYDVRAFQYVMKPYEADKIVDILINAIQEKNLQAGQVLSFEKGSKIYKIPWRDILYLQSSKRLVVVKTQHDSYEFYGKLDELEEELAGPFVRCHLRYIVNLAYVKAVDAKTIQLPNEVLPISKSKYHSVMIAFAKHMLE